MEGIDMLSVEGSWGTWLPGPMGDFAQPVAIRAAATTTDKTIERFMKTSLEQVSVIQLNGSNATDMPAPD